MPSVKATLVLDQESARNLTLAAERTGKTKSAIVREAINEFREARRLSGEHRSRRLGE